VNLTLAATVWGRPLTPFEILNDDEFKEKVEFQISTNQRGIEKRYFRKKPELREIPKKVVTNVETVKKGRRAVDDLQMAAQQLGDQEPGPAILSQISLCRTDLRSVNISVTAITQKLEKNSLSTADVRTLLVGFPGATTPRPSRIEKLNKSLGTLA